ncbi:DUF2000 domain-containing protein [Pelosinus sp. sgz500959]|uniref:DUF2000 domain-containing protein n=1 Tax=Pelosinus sp. sgz500959 TaxID=3242472 RepID=UPI003671018A
MKIVMVINKELPLGLVANTAAVLGISLSNIFQQDIVGCDIEDANGNVHIGITAQTIPILSGSREQIKDMRDLMFGSTYSEITVIDFSEVAQKCLDYQDYIRLLSSLQSSDLYYLGICLYGPKKKVNKLTGNLGLLR